MLMKSTLDEIFETFCVQLSTLIWKDQLSNLESNGSQPGVREKSEGFQFKCH